MPYRSVGRPAAEIQALRDNAVEIIPYSEFGRVGTTDDTTTLQTAWDYSSDTGQWVGQEGDFKVNTLVIRNGMRVRSPGVKTSRIIMRTGSAEESLISLAEDVVQNVELGGFEVVGNAGAGQHGLHLRAVAGMASGFLQGGLWYFRFHDMFVSGFEGETFWLDGGGSASGDPAAFRAPIQFGTFEKVICLSGHTKRSLRISGQVGQVGFDEASEFDGFNTGGFFTPWVAENILIERARTITDTLDSDAAPYAILFKGTTCQGNKRLVTIERAGTVTMLGMHFENAEEGILNSISAYGNVVDKCYFGRVGYRASADGWTVKNNGGVITCRDLGHAEVPGEPVGWHYVSDFDQPIILQGYHDAEAGIRTKGVSHSAISSTPTVEIFPGRIDKTIPIIGPQDTPVTNIKTQSLLPDHRVIFRATGGAIAIDNGGAVAGTVPIDITPFQSPLRVREGEQVELYYVDKADGTPGTFRVASVTGQRGHIHPPPSFVGSATVGAPYTPNAESGTLKVDSHLADAYIKMPEFALVPTGTRITIKKIDSSTHKVFINGWSTPENVEGFTDNLVFLTRQLQSVTLEKSRVTGSGGWEIVAFHPGVGTGWATPDGVASGSMSTAGALTFGTHLTPAAGTFDGSAAVTLATDSTSAATANTLVERDSGGATKLGTNTVIGGPSGSIGVKANTNLLLYDINAGNWAGIQTDGAGEMCFNVGLTSGARYSMVLGNDGRLYAPNALIFTGSLPAFAPGMIGFYTPYGLVLQAATGTTYDFALLNPAASSAIFTVPTGTLNASFTGDVIANGKFQAGGVGNVFGGPQGTSGVYANQNVFLYNASSTNWAGMQAAGNGDMSFSVGTASRFLTVYDAASGAWTIPHNIIFTTNTRGLMDGAGTLRLTIKSGVGVDVTGAFTSGDANFLSGIFHVQSSGPTASKPISVTTSTGATGVDVADTAGASGFSITPHSSSDGAFYDNRRVGSSTFFRSSLSTQSDRTWLSVTAGGAVTFVTTASFGGAVIITSAAGGYALTLSDTSGNSGLSITPHSSGDSALIDNGRVGSQTLFRCSSASSFDVTWMTVSSAGATTFSGLLTVNNTVVGVRAVFQSSTGAGSNFIIRDTSGLVQLSFQSATSADGAFIDNSRIGSSTFFRSSNASAGDTTWLSVTAAGLPTFGNGLQTSAPAGGTAARWKLGSRVNASISTDFSKYIEVDVGGTLYGLMTKT